MHRKEAVSWSPLKKTTTKSVGGRIDNIYVAKVKEIDYLTISNEL